jgi:ATP-dependent 26S proteasome regulatory subunit
MAITPSNSNKKISETQAGGMNISKNESFQLTEGRYELSDVIANAKTLLEIRSLISLKKNHARVFGDMGLSETHKHSKKFIINFYGEPGTGKTITAHAIAKAFNKKLLLIDYSEIESKYVGETPKNIRRVFDFAKENDCIIFFDEADAILSKRVTNMQSANDTSVNQTRSVMLNILNDFEGDLIFATNFISNYDSAFMRRISKHVYFELPDSDSRKRLIEKYTPKKHISYFDLDVLTAASEGLSAADLEKVILLAAFQAAHHDRVQILQQDVLDQIQHIKKSKMDNSSNRVTIDTKIVSDLPANIQFKEKQ